METQQHSPFPNTCAPCLSERWKWPVWITPKVHLLLSPPLTVAAPDALGESEKNPSGTTSWAASLQSGKASSAFISSFSYPSSWLSALSNMFVSSMTVRKLFKSYFTPSAKLSIEWQLQICCIRLLLTQIHLTPSLVQLSNLKYIYQLSQHQKGQRPRLIACLETEIFTCLS